MLKKFIAAMLLPIPLALMISGIGLYLLWFTKYQRLGKSAATTGVLMICVLSFTTVANLVVSPLENSYPTFDTDQVPVKYVVVLGNQHVTDERLPVTSRLSSTSLARLVEGIRIYQASPDSRLILSGWGGRDPVPNAVAVANVAMALGIPAADIITEPRAKDTHDEATLLQAIIGDAPFALVTSATHMLRAMGLFRQQGMKPIAAPTDYLAKTRANGNHRLQFRAENLEKVEKAAHEYLGLAWSTLRGQI